MRLNLASLAGLRSFIEEVGDEADVMPSTLNVTIENATVAHGAADLAQIMARALADQKADRSL